MLLGAPIESWRMERGSYGIGSLAPPALFSSTASAAEAGQSLAELADFCSFTLGRAQFISHVRGADGSTLPLHRRQVLRALNRVSRNIDLTPQQRDALESGLLGDERLVRHLRYILVQSGIEMDPIIDECGGFTAPTSAVPSPESALGAALELLNDGVPSQ